MCPDLQKTVCERKFQLPNTKLVNLLSSCSAITRGSMSSTFRSSARNVRLMARSGALSGPTANLAPGFAQANLVILPRELAYDFLLFFQRNTKACPLLGVSDPGKSIIEGLGEDLDIRTDAPRYRIWKAGELVDEPREVTHVWRDELVAFAIGCSFSFEEIAAKLRRAGATHRRGPQRTHVSDINRYRSIRCFLRSARSLDAAHVPRRCDQGSTDHGAAPFRSRRSDPYRRSGSNRHSRRLPS